MSEDTEKQCRFCLEDEGDLISPCQCSGTSKWVHRNCLDNWRTSQYSYRCFTHCNTCNFQYRIRYRNEHRCLSNKTKVRLFVARDLISILLVLQILIAAVGAVVYAIDHATGSEILKGISGGDAAVGVYYLCGILAFLALLGLFTLVGACCCSSDACQCDDDTDDALSLYVVPLVTVAGGVIPAIQHGIVILYTMAMGQLVVVLLDLVNVVQEIVVLVQAVMDVALVEILDKL